MNHYIVLLATITATLFSVAQGNCAEDWAQWGLNCYRYEGQYKKNWTEAAEDCKQLAPSGTTGHLVTVHSKKENTFLRSYWAKRRGKLPCRKWQYFWLGFNDIEEEGKFVWVDGSNVTYTNWGGNQPDNRFNDSDCATMAGKKGFDIGLWDDARCFGKRPYICEYRCNNCTEPVQT